MNSIIKTIFTTVSGFALLSSASAFAANQPVTPKTGYFPVIVHNDTNDSNNIKQIYFMALAKQYDGTPCALQFTSQQVGGQLAEVGQCINISQTMNTQNYTYDFTQFPAYSQSSHSVLLYIPQVISGRAYISLNHKLTVPILSEPNNQFAFQMPNMNNPSDQNYNILYDKFEYTYDNTKTFWINPTSVDFFALPISLQSFDQKVASGAPIGSHRNDLLTTIKDTIQSHDNSAGAVWSTAFVYDLSKATSTMLRVGSPGVAPGFPLRTYLVTGNNSYFDQLVAYYAKNTIQVDASELIGDKKYVPLKAKCTGNPLDPQLYQYTGKISTINGAPTWVFSSAANCQIKGQAKSNEQPYTVKIPLSDKGGVSQGFFMPGQAPFATPDNTVQSVIIKNITSAFAAGLLPAEPGAKLDKTFFVTHKKTPGYYRANPYLDNNNMGPWYDLYSKGIHQAIPITYAYAYDDVLGQDGTLNSQNNAEPISIILGDMSGTQIPSPYVPAAAIKPVQSPKNNSSIKSANKQNCTISASWTVPSGQATDARYFILPQGFTNISLGQIVAKQGALLPASATTGSYTLLCSQLSIPKNTQPKLQVFACVPGSDDHACPNAKNGYNMSKTTGTSPF